MWSVLFKAYNTKHTIVIKLCVYKRVQSIINEKIKWLITGGYL